MQLSCCINSPIIKMLYNVKQRPERNLQKVFCLIFRVRNSTTFVLLTIHNMNYFGYEPSWKETVLAGRFSILYYLLLLSGPSKTQDNRQQKD